MNSKFMKLLLCVIILSFAAPVFGQRLLTEHEKNGFDKYTSYDNMVKFLHDLKATSTEMQLGTYGKTLTGSDLVYAVFGRPAISKPWEALVSKKPIVMVAANIHGGERTLRESLLMLTRELATPGTEANGLLDHIIVLVVPSVNPDGFNATERGTRGNLRGIDLNRDYMKLEQPALANYVKNILHTWHPHAFVDGHNGGSFPYQVCYQGPSNASVDPGITLMCDREIFPMIDAKMEASGYKSWYYSSGNEERWSVGGSDPRIGRNYGGLMNSIGILFESPGGMDREKGAKSGAVAYKAVLQYVAANSEKVKNLVDRVRTETIEMGKKALGDVVVQMEYEPEDYKVNYLIGEGGRRGGGNQQGERKIIEVKNAEIIKKPVPTLTRKRPYAYILMPQDVPAIEMLKRHGIKIEKLTKDIELDVQVYALDSVTRGKEYDHFASVSIFVNRAVDTTITFPKGSFVIQTGQVMGRVVAHMLEPETNDNIFKWNTMDYAIPTRFVRGGFGRGFRRGGAAPAQDREPPKRITPILPMFKLIKPMALPTVVVN